MADKNSLLISLEEFGLGKYESQAYAALISKGTISASELAYYSEIPRTKVYPILLKLAKKNLVTISKGKPVMCTSISPEYAFDDIIQAQINKINAMNMVVSNLKKINDTSKKSRGIEEKRYFHLAANNTIDRLKIMIESSKNSICIMSDQWGLGLLAECKKQLLSALRRDIEIKVIIPSLAIGSEAFKILPKEINIRVSEIIQNCFIFDEIELLLINSANGKGAIFSTTDILGVNQTRLFTNIWKNAIKTDSLADMTKIDAQEIYHIIQLINKNALGHVLDSDMISKNQFELLKILDKNGINLNKKSIDDIVEIVDSALHIMCSGHANFDAKAKNILIESKINSGHSLPWVAILNEYLQRSGYKTRMTYKNQAQQGEKVHLKFSA